jgi:hypothetical protein
LESLICHPHLGKRDKRDTGIIQGPSTEHRESTDRELGASKVLLPAEGSPLGVCLLGIIFPDFMTLRC